MYDGLDGGGGVKIVLFPGNEQKPGNNKAAGDRQGKKLARETNKQNHAPERKGDNTLRKKGRVSY